MTQQWVAVRYQTLRQAHIGDRADPVLIARFLKTERRYATMKTNLKAWAILLVIVFLAVLVGCHSRAGEMTEQGMGDKQLALAVSSKINEDPLLKDMPIGVASYEKEITLSGAVNTPEQKKHATQVAASISGVKKVNNLLLEP
jgi:hyperosmotically inducible protein